MVLGPWNVSVLWRGNQGPLLILNTNHSVAVDLEGIYDLRAHHIILRQSYLKRFQPCACQEEKGINTFSMATQKGYKRKKSSNHVVEPRSIGSRMQSRCRLGFSAVSMTICNTFVAISFEAAGESACGFIYSL